MIRSCGLPACSLRAPRQDFLPSIFDCSSNMVLERSWGPFWLNIPSTWPHLGAKMAQLRVKMEPRWAPNGEFCRTKNINFLIDFGSDFLTIFDGF